MQQIGNRPRAPYNRFTTLIRRLKRVFPHPIGPTGGIAVLGLALLMGLYLSSQLSPLAPAKESRKHSSGEDDTKERKIFLQGRQLLLSGKSAQALPCLQEAGRLMPENPEYAYYEGLAYQAMDNLILERTSYQRGLQYATDSIPLLLNLGHNFLESDELDAALAQYEKVLSLNPEVESALYNRALIYENKGQARAAKRAWLQYLHQHRSGKWAWRAVSHLNNLGDFSFRSYQLGYRKLVLSHQALLGENNSPGDREKEIRVLGLLLRDNPELDLHIVTYEEKNIGKAKSQARELKNLLLSTTGKQAHSRIRLSWFGEAETFTAVTHTYRLAKGILIFTSKRTETTEEKHT